ncbi:uncharacterized protein [Epargyreus clarus]|uniref:uncharacterized protein n=1 Tax=Epargyreus clarus TaxID=520877 RepID=UPI003C2DD78E
MHVKVPDVNKCCFCIPLRHGILIFAYLNFLFSIVSVAWLVITTELKRQSITADSSLEIMTSTVLFSILGMGVILNLLLIIAAHQKDISMLRLYNYYAVATLLAAMVPSFILLSRRMFSEVIVALLALAMQFYVIILVRSEVIKLEKKLLVCDQESRPQITEQAVDIPDRITLL